MRLTENEDLEFGDILKHLDIESAHFIIRRKTHHSGRLVTIVQPHRLTKDANALLGLAHKLKQTLGTGGGVEEGRIVLHGDHRDAVKNELVKLGVPADSIEMI
jgi:translation initiation factor 1